MACGADASYIYEEKFNIKDLLDCLYRMAEKFNTKKITRGLVLRSNCLLLKQCAFRFMKIIISYFEMYIITTFVVILIFKYQKNNA